MKTLYGLLLIVVLGLTGCSNTPQSCACDFINAHEKEDWEEMKKYVEPGGDWDEVIARGIKRNADFEKDAPTFFKAFPEQKEIYEKRKEEVENYRFDCSTITVEWNDGNINANLATIWYHDDSCRGKKCFLRMVKIGSEWKVTH